MESDDERGEGKKGQQMRKRRARQDDTVTGVPSYKGNLLTDLQTRQPYRRRKSGGNPEEVQLHRRHEHRASIAGSSLFPRHPPMRSLPSREWGTGFRAGKRSNRQDGDRDGLCPQHCHPLASRLAPTPIFPQDRVNSWRKHRRKGRFRRWSDDWPEHGTDASRFDGSRPLFLTVFAEQTGAAMTDPRGIEHP